MNRRLPPPVRLSILVVATALLAAGCASALRLTDEQGREHSGALTAATNSMTANIDGKTYRGRYSVNDWGQGKSTLLGPANEKLNCTLVFEVLKVRGTCAGSEGGEYRVQNR